MTDAGSAAKLLGYSPFHLLPSLLPIVQCSPTSSRGDPRAPRPRAVMALTTFFSTSSSRVTISKSSLALLLFLAAIIAVAIAFIFRQATHSMKQVELANEAAARWLLDPEDVKARAEGTPANDPHVVPWFYDVVDDVQEWVPYNKMPSRPAAAEHAVCLWGPGSANARATSLFRSLGGQVEAPAVEYGSGQYRYILAGETNKCAQLITGPYTEVLVLQFKMAYQQRQLGWQQQVTTAQLAASASGIPFFAISTGDELCEQVTTPAEDLPPHPMLLYRAYWSAEMRHGRYVQFMPLGVRDGFRVPLLENVRKVRSRPYAFNFAGSLTSTERLVLQAVVQQRGLLQTYEGYFSLATKWAPGDPVLQPRAYMKLLATSVFTLCPAGHSPEAFRIYEAAAAGSIPVVVVGDGYRTHRCHNAYEPLIQSRAPIIFLASWAELPTLLTKAATELAWVNELQAKVRPWFDTFMGDFITHFETTLAAARASVTAAVANPYWTEPGLIDYAVASRIVPANPPVFEGGFPRKRPTMQAGRIPLVTGCGRSGSGTVAAFLPTVSIPAVHEGSAEGAVSVGWPYAATNHTGAYPFEGKASVHRQAVAAAAGGGGPWGPVVHLVRHPLDVISSVRHCFCGSGVLLTNKSLLANQRSWDHLCAHTTVPCGDVLPNDSLLKATLYWLRWNELVRASFPNATVVRLEMPDAPARLVDGLGFTVFPGKKKAASAVAGEEGAYTVKLPSGAAVDLPPTFPQLGHISMLTQGFQARQELTWADLRLRLGHAVANDVILAAAAYGYPGLPDPSVGTPLGRQIRQQERPHTVYVPASSAEPVVVGGLGGAGGPLLVRVLGTLGVRMSSPPGSSSSGDSSEWSMPLQLCNQHGLGTLDGICTRHQLRCCSPGWPYGGVWFDDRLTPPATHGHGAFTAPDPRGSRVAMESSRCSDETEVDDMEGCSRSGLLALAGRSIKRLAREAKTTKAAEAQAAVADLAGSPPPSTMGEILWGFKHPATMVTLPLLAEVTGGRMKFILVLEDGRKQMLQRQQQLVAYCAPLYRRMTAEDNVQLARQLRLCQRMENHTFSFAEQPATTAGKAGNAASLADDDKAALQLALQFWSDYNQDAYNVAREVLDSNRILLMRLEDLTDPMPQDETLIRLARFLGTHPAGSAAERDAITKTRALLDRLRTGADGDVQSLPPPSQPPPPPGLWATIERVVAGRPDLVEGFARFGYRGRQGGRSFPSQELDTAGW